MRPRSRPSWPDKEAIAQWQEELYQDLHAHPELGHQEARTAATVAAELRALGFEVHEGIGTTGVVGTLANGDGEVVLMRADMDGLPVAEATGLPYASSVRVTDDAGNEVPVMHACGHDVHVAWLLGAARLLARATGSWSGTYVALFQPAEELADGAHRMVEDGLAGIIPKPDVALAQHVLASRAPWGLAPAPSSRSRRACGSPSTAAAATGRCRTWASTRRCWPR